MGWAASFTMRRTRALVPTGTVLLSTSTVSCVTLRATVSATWSTARRSAAPSERCGVPTAMKTAWDAATAAGTSAENDSRPASTL
jgi:hypothetical protein